jgi:hypothetical protein
VTPTCASRWTRCGINSCILSCSLCHHVAWHVGTNVWSSTLTIQMYLPICTALQSRRLVFIFTGKRIADFTGSNWLLNAMSRGLLTVRYAASWNKNYMHWHCSTYWEFWGLSRSGSFHQFPPLLRCLISRLFQYKKERGWKIETIEDNITISSSYMSQRNVHNTRNKDWLVAYNKGKRNTIEANSFTSKQKRSLL